VVLTNEVTTKMKDEITTPPPVNLNQEFQNLKLY
jgi:hypothetical protein